MASPSRKLHTSTTLSVNSNLSKIFTLPVVLAEAQRTLTTSSFCYWTWLEHFYLCISKEIACRLSLWSLSLERAVKTCHSYHLPHPSLSSTKCYTNSGVYPQFFSSGRHPSLEFFAYLLCIAQESKAVTQGRVLGNSFRNFYLLTEGIRTRVKATHLSPEVAEGMSWTWIFLFFFPNPQTVE